jgi:undecaprenyl diphosphate synthase
MPNFREQIEKNKVCFRFFGDLQKLPQRLRDLIEEVQNITKDFKK